MAELKEEFYDPTNQMALLSQIVLICLSLKKALFGLKQAPRHGMTLCQVSSGSRISQGCRRSHLVPSPEQQNTLFMLSGPSTEVTSGSCSVPWCIRNKWKKGVLELYFVRSELSTGRFYPLKAAATRRFEFILPRLGMKCMKPVTLKSLRMSRWLHPGLQIGKARRQKDRCLPTKGVDLSSPGMDYVKSVCTTSISNQFWDTIRFDSKAGSFKCQLDEQWFNLNQDTLRDALQINPAESSVSYKILWGIVNRAHIDYAERMWEEFTQSIHTFTEDKRKLAQHTLGKKKATLILIPSIGEEAQTSCLNTSRIIPLAKRAKAGKVVKKRTAKSSKRLVDEFVDEGVPAAKPSLEDTEEAILQKVLQESLTDAYPTQRGPLPPVVIREPDIGRGCSSNFQLVTAGRENPLSLYAGVGLSGSDTESDEEMPSVGRSGNQDGGQAGSDPGTRDEGQAGSNPGTLDEGQAGSDHCITGPLQSTHQPEQMDEEQQQPTSSTTTSTSQGSSESLLIKRMGELEQHIADRVEENQALESRLEKQGSRIRKLETMDWTNMIREQTTKFIESYEIDRKIEDSVKEVVSSSVKHAMRSSSSCLIQGSPYVLTWKGILLQRMLEENFDKGHAEPPNWHMKHTGAIRRDERCAIRSFWTTRALILPKLLPSLYTTPVSSTRLEVHSDDLLFSDEDTTADVQVLSSDDEVGRDHVPTVNLRQSWWKPLTEDRPSTPEPAWTIPSSDLSMPTNNWASALKSTYAHNHR
ncbi:hypothetical protein Tco_1383190 [Tanacetum coccineum]